MSNKTAAVITGLGIGTMLIVAGLPTLITAGIGIAMTTGILFTYNGYEKGKYDK